MSTISKGSKSTAENSKRVIMRIELTPQAKAELARYCEIRGKKQIAAMSKLVEWFGKCPDSIQAVIQQDIPPSFMPDVAKLILERAARLR
jgi:hypothetical protein